MRTLVELGDGSIVSCKVKRFVASDRLSDGIEPSKALLLSSEALLFGKMSVEAGKGIEVDRSLDVAALLCLPRPSFFFGSSTRSSRFTTIVGQTSGSLSSGERCDLIRAVLLNGRQASSKISEDASNPRILDVFPLLPLFPLRLS